jgi:hypothetical protein
VDGVGKARQKANVVNFWEGVGGWGGEGGAGGSLGELVAFRGCRIKLFCLVVLGSNYFDGEKENWEVKRLSFR